METHTKKQLLGFVGLATVAAMTFAAYTIPGPEASAESFDEAIMTLNILEKAQISLTSPTDGLVTLDGKIPVSVDYSNAAELSYYLTYTDSSGNKVTKLIRRYCPAGTGGSCDGVADTDIATGKDSFTLDLDQYAGYSDYVLSVTTRYGAAAEDAASFAYVTSKPEDSGTDENGNPVIDIEVSEEAEYVLIQVYDEDGNPVFPSPIRVPVGADGKIHVALPFDSYGLNTGKYTVVISAYDADGNFLGASDLKLEYTGSDQIDVPNTGGLTIGNLNLAQTDYLVTGLVAFGFVAAFALYSLRRGKRQR